MQHTYSFCLVKDGMYGGYRIIYPDFHSINYTKKTHERCITFAKKRLLSIICNRYMQPHTYTKCIAYANTGQLY